MVVVGALLVFSPQTLIDNISFGVAPTWTDFLLAIPLGMIAYTGIETISNMAEEAKDEAVTIPKAIARVRTAVYAIYFTLPVVALSALPVTRDPATGEYQHAARRRRGGRRLRRRPDPRRRQAARPRLPAAARRALRRPARRDDPADRDERRDHRRVAPGLLDGHPPPGARPPAPAAPQVQHAVDRDPRLRRRRVPHAAARTGRRSWATCTRSARCCRSRSRTRRSSACA